jgi:hypothetical protein
LTQKRASQGLFSVSIQTASHQTSDFQAHAV